MVYSTYKQQRVLYFSSLVYKSTTIVSLLRSCSKLGWAFRGNAYYQLIREANKVKRLEWAQKHLQTALRNEFTDMVWTDECIVMLECHRWFCCRKNKA